MSRHRPGPGRSAVLASIALHGVALVGLVAAGHTTPGAGDSSPISTVELVAMPAQEPAAPASIAEPTPTHDEIASSLPADSLPADSLPADSFPIERDTPAVASVPPPQRQNAATRAPISERTSARPRPHTASASRSTGTTGTSSEGLPRATTATSDVAAAIVPAAGPPVITRAQYRERPTPPVYPRRARELNITGTTVLRALVDRDGRTREVRIWRSSGSDALDEAAANAARRWAFAPAQIDGRAVEAWVEIPVNFELR